MLSFGFRQVGVLVCLAAAYLVGPATASAMCFSGTYGPHLAGNAAGEKLVVWSEHHGASEDEDRCESEVTDAAIGSSGAGFTPIGTVSPGPGIYESRGAFIDEAGDAWVVGGHTSVVSVMKYGPVYGVVGAWVAYRPASGGAVTRVQLPIRGPRSLVEPILIAGNAKGQVLLAWGTKGGTYLEWDSGGQLSRPWFVGGEFTTTSIGVDEYGDALVVGYYFHLGVSAIATVTLSPTGRPSKAHVIARRNRHRALEPPIAGVGPNGAAIIAWETPRHCGPGLGCPVPDMLVHGNVNDHLSAPKRFSTNFLHAELLSNDASIGVDAAGRAVIIAKNYREREITIGANGAATSLRYLGGRHATGFALGVNAQGALVLGWTEGSLLETELGTTTGQHEEPVAIQTSRYPEPFSATINANGEATVGWREGGFRESEVEEQRIEVRALPDGPTVQIPTPAPG